MVDAQAAQPADAHDVQKRVAAAILGWTSSGMLRLSSWASAVEGYQ